MVAVARKPIHQDLDRRVRECLTVWPQRPPGIEPSVKQPGTWLKGRPNPGPTVQPYLKVPGSERLRTLPDGLYLHFSPRPDDLYVDILCIEACSTYQNLLDKRARFAPSTHSLLAVCPLPWLLGPVSADDPTPRWRLTGILRAEPVGPLTLPVRDVRVLYGLRDQHYSHFMSGQVPQAHEFFCPIGALTRERGYEEPRMQKLMARLSAANNFLDPAG